MGTITAAIKKKDSDGSGLIRVVDLTMSSSYATGGDSLPSDAALGLLHSLDAIVLSGDAGGRVFEVDHANRKVKAFRDVTPAANAPLAEETAGTNLSGTKIRAIVYGDHPHA